MIAGAKAKPLVDLARSQSGNAPGVHIHSSRLQVWNPSGLGGRIVGASPLHELPLLPGRVSEKSQQAFGGPIAAHYFADHLVDHAAVDHYLDALQGLIDLDSL